MREITEAQAQKLANLSGCFLTQEYDSIWGSVSCILWTSEPKHDVRYQGWFSYLDGDYFQLELRIISRRPWTEQIWRPKAK